MTQSKTLPRESQTLETLIALYCRDHHQMPEGALCDACQSLLTYARSRLEKCPYGEKKPACSACPIHCYTPKRRKEIQDVMRYAGPRMMRSHPILALGHLIKQLKKPPTVKP